MALGYQKIVDHFGYCPTVIATGGLSCGKTTSLMSALSTIGCHKSGLIKNIYNLNNGINFINFSIALFSRSTLSFIFKKCCQSSFPIGWDDPSDTCDLNQLLVDVFHKTTRGTAKEEEEPLTTPLVTVNDDKLRKVLR